MGFHTDINQIFKQYISDGYFLLHIDDITKILDDKRIPKRKHEKYFDELEKNIHKVHDKSWNKKGDKLLKIVRPVNIPMQK